MNDNNFKKKKKRLEQIAIEIEDKQAEFAKIVEESKKILELTEREYNNTISGAETKLFKTRKQVIHDTGKFLENNLEIVTNNSLDHISRMIKKEFKGILKPNTVHHNCPDKWKSAIHAKAGKIGAGVSNSNRGIRSGNKSKPLTEYEQQYVNLHNEKVTRNTHIVALIDGFLGLTESEKTAVFAKVQQTGSKFHNALINEAYNNLLRIVKTLNDPDIPALLDDIRFLKQILDKVSEMALQEHEIRKNKTSMIGT